MTCVLKEVILLHYFLDFEIHFPHVLTARGRSGCTLMLCFCENLLVLFGWSLFASVKPLLRV